MRKVPNQLESQEGTGGTGRRSSEGQGVALAPKPRRSRRAVEVPLRPALSLVRSAPTHESPQLAGVGKNAVCLEVALHIVAPLVAHPGEMLVYVPGQCLYRLASTSPHEVVAGFSVHRGTFFDCSVLLYKLQRSGALRPLAPADGTMLSMLVPLGEHGSMAM